MADIQPPSPARSAQMGMAHSFSKNWMLCIISHSCLFPQLHSKNAGINRAIMGLMLGLLGLRVLWEGVPSGGAVYGQSELLSHTAAFALGKDWRAKYIGAADWLIRRR